MSMAGGGGEALGPAAVVSTRGATAADAAAPAAAAPSPPAAAADAISTAAHPAGAGSVLGTVGARGYLAGGYDGDGEPQSDVAATVCPRTSTQCNSYTPLHGPARTVLRPGSPRNSVGSVRVSDKVRAGPVGPV